MLRIPLIVSIVFLSFSYSYPQQDFDIGLKHGSEREKLTKIQLERLLDTYDLSKWIMTREIVIDEKSIPHSHPVLSLSARHLKDDELLVSTFVHEQMHWFLSEKSAQTEAAVAEFKKMYPKVPVRGGEGARSEYSTYLHIAVIYLEYLAVREIFGELKGRQIMDFWKYDHYRWIYRTVLENRREIGSVMVKHGLIPGISKQKKEGP